MRLSIFQKHAVGTVSMLVGLFFSLNAQGASVFVQFPPDGLLFDPSQVSSSGNNYSTSADLQSGTFTGLSDITAPDFSFTHAGINQLTLTNNTANQMQIGAGMFMVSLEGMFTFSPGGAGQSAGGASGQAILTVTLVSQLSGATQFIAGAGNDPTTSYFDGIPFQIFDGNLSIIESNGGSVVVNQANNSGLRADLLMPGMTLDPGDFLEISFFLSTTAGGTNGASATADFTNTARLFLTLPTGGSLTNDATVPLDWIQVQSIPVPAAVWLFASGLLGLIGAKGSDQTKDYR